MQAASARTRLELAHTPQRCSGTLQNVTGSVDAAKTRVVRYDFACTILRTDMTSCRIWKFFMTTFCTSSTPCGGSPA